MTGLQTAFYIIGIVYMGISLLIILGILIAIGVIRKKVTSLENTIKEKLSLVTTATEKASEVISTVKKFKSRKK